MSDSEEDRFWRHVKASIDLQKAAEGPAFYWASLPLCIIDSVFSIRAHYERVVQKLVNTWCKSHDPCWAGEWRTRPVGNVGPTVQDFTAIIERRLKQGISYAMLFGNKQRTSTRNGILKAEAVHRFARVLVEHGVNQFDDLHNDKKMKAAEAAVMKIPGQGSGLTFTYFQMLAGDEDFVKADTHVRRFVSDGLGIDWKNVVSAERASELVKAAAAWFKRRLFRVDSHAAGSRDLELSEIASQTITKWAICRYAG